MKQEVLFRTLFFVLFLLTLSISAYHRRTAQKSGEVIPRRAEGTLALALRLLLALPLLISILLYTFLPDWMAWSTLQLPTWIRWLGAGTGIACLTLLWSVFRTIGPNISETVLTKRDHQLITCGPYRWVRHPLYAVALLEILALSLLAANGFMLVLWAIGVAAFRLVVIPAEEKNLLRAFGSQYAAYRHQTGVLVPRIR